MSATDAPKGLRSFIRNTEGIRPRWSACLLAVALSVPGGLYALPAASEELVRVFLKRETQGVLHEAGFIPQARVQEILELSGAVIDPRGFVVSYVGRYGPAMETAEVKVVIETADGQKFPARLVGVDERFDLAFLQSQRLAGRAVRSTSEFTGGRLLLWGGGGKTARPSLVKVGRIAAPQDREIYVSGLPELPERKFWHGHFLLDLHGRLLGIVRHSRPHPFSRRIHAFDVLPADVLRSSFEEVLERGASIRAGWLGVEFDKSSDVTRVLHVIAGSPAERAGLRPGDAIRELDGHRLAGFVQLIRGIRSKGEGGRLNLSVLRQGEAVELVAELGVRPHEPPRTFWKVELPRVWEDRAAGENEPLRIYRTVAPKPLQLGLDLSQLTPQLAEYFKCPRKEGLLVQSVIPGSPAHRVGFRAGDVLVRINGDRVSTPSDFPRLVQQAEEGYLAIEFIRQGKLETTRLVLP